MMNRRRGLLRTHAGWHDRIPAYWEMTKSLQTGLLLLTGIAGYISARSPVLCWQMLLGLAGSLYLSISGATVVNMVLDHDLDARMDRTCWRPLPSGRVSLREAAAVGGALSLLGLGWALVLAPLYGLLVLAGLFFDVVIYTVWLKRRTAWSVVFGGIAGAMPVLAGRALGVGAVDWIGLALALAVLLWIPTHIMTFSLRYRHDYARAGVPTFPEVYGSRTTQVTIAISSMGAAAAVAASALGIGMAWGYLRLLAVLSAGLVLLAASAIFRPSERTNFGLFKYASVYMLSSMALVLVAALE